MIRHCPFVLSLLTALLTTLANQARDSFATEPQRFSTTPLSELRAGKYRGQDGGLYGKGRNEPPAGHRAATNKALAQIRPLDVRGRPSADGRIVLLGLGMSNTTQEFEAFQRLAAKGGKIPAQVVLVNGAQGGQDARSWTVNQQDKTDPWQVVLRRLAQAGVTPTQVQCVWIKQALARPAQYGEFPGHATTLEKDLVAILTRAQTEYPNLRLAYLSSRTYGGYASNWLNPEPYAFESAFAVRRVIQRQIAGEAALSFDATRGKAKVPVILWGPYLWADGERPRKDRGLAWTREDVMPDGTHPSFQGCRKIGEILLHFFADDPHGPRMFVQK